MKKKINIVLILAVLGLWGTAGYRFVSNYFADDVLTYAAGPKSTYSAKLVTQRDTFSLGNIGRDPFLNKLASTTSAGSVPATKANYKRIIKSPVAKPVAQPKFWPDVQYLGYIKSGKNDEVVLLKINGQLMRLRKGENRSDLVVKAIYKDSIAVVFNREKKIFKHS